MTFETDSKRRPMIASTGADDCEHLHTAKRGKKTNRSEYARGSGSVERFHPHILAANIRSSGPQTWA